MLVFSMLLSLSVTAFAVEKPAVDHDGMTIFVGDVRVEKKDTKNSVEIDAVITAGSDYTTVRGGTLNFDIDSTTTGINATDTLDYGTAGRNDVRMISADEGLTTTGKGAVSFAQGKVNPLTIKLTLPNVTATTKINVSGTGMYIAPPTAGKEIDSSKIKVVSGSVIVQYPVTVNIATDSDTNAGFAISTTTTAHNDKATYDMAGADTTTLTTGGIFYVDSGEGQQNTPKLNFTVPENYYAEVTVNDGVKQTVGTSSFALPEVTQDTTVSVKLVAGKVPSDEYTKTSMSYRYGNYDLAAQDTKRFDKKGTDNTVAIKNFDGYKLVKYQINSDPAVTENLGTSVTVDNTKDNSIVFTYERQDNSTVVPGPNGTIGGGDDVTITPVDKNLPTIAPDSTGAVTLPADKQGVVSDDNGNSVVVPGGTKIDKNGQIWLPGQTAPTTPQNPKPTEGFYEVTYMNGGVKLFTQLGKVGQEVDVMDYPASAQKPEGKTFDGWNELDAGTGTPHSVGSKISGEKTLHAQWRNTPVDPGTLNSAKITYYSNESTSPQAKEEVRSNKVDEIFPGMLDANAFDAPSEGWTLAGWLRKDDGSNKIYSANQMVTLKKGDNWTLYAQ